MGWISHFHTTITNNELTETMTTKTRVPEKEIQYLWFGYLSFNQPNIHAITHRGYLFFSVKDLNLFHRVDTIGNIFTSGEATTENITDGVHEMK